MYPSWATFFLPVVIAIQTAMIVGCALIVSALQVKFRDVEYIVQLLLMVLFFLTPGVYTLEDVAARASPALTRLYLNNPLVGVLNLFRITLISDYASTLPPQVNALNTLIVPVVCACGLVWAGYAVFKKWEGRFSDYLNT
jgi:ABC-2 type transport system permease protein